jgi:CheY-like chemotaxis protein
LGSYSALLREIPSHPEVRSCSNGAHALALLDSEPFTMLICDLKMPKMDGLQVIAIARRKFPALRIVVLTAVGDEKYRARAYSMGAELFWRKPATREELLLFQDCVESLLGQQAQAGFRGMQNKSLVDIIQLECLSHCSSVLRIVQGAQEGRIWLQNGEVIDAQANQLSGEEAFREIFSWHSGNFEILPPQADRPRTIHNSCQGLLLDSAQALDEAQQGSGNQPAGSFRRRSAKSTSRS